MPTLPAARQSRASAPAGTRLVQTAHESIRTWGILYGPDMAEPPLRATTGPISLYAPVLKFGDHLARHQHAVFSHAGFYAHGRGMFAYRDKFFFSFQYDLYRPIRLPCQKRRQSVLV